TSCYRDWSSDVCSSDLAVGSPSVMRMICLFLPRDLERSVRAVEKACCMFVPYTYSFQVRPGRSDGFSSCANAEKPTMYRSSFGRSEERRVGKEWATAAT